VMAAPKAESPAAAARGVKAAVAVGAVDAAVAVAMAAAHGPKAAAVPPVKPCQGLRA
jgi:hypothetical protein